MFQSDSLDEWLTYLESLHPVAIEMGLSRVLQVKERMNLQPKVPVITVAGTNGKGSVCAFLTAIYHAAGFRVGTLTSPHLLRFNERIAINGTSVTDALIMQALAQIEAARKEISLTYFEFNTLAAMSIFMTQNVEVMVLEVGLGGRLDAVNVFDTDCAVLTSVALDHQAYLGNTVEEVGYEKAGIFRSETPAVCGQNPPPKSVVDYAAKIGAKLFLLGKDFGISKMQNQCSFGFGERKRHALPIPALRGTYQMSNAACALAVIECLYPKLPVDIGAIKRGLVEVTHTGRFQVLAGRPMVVLDVGHNPHAVRALVGNLQTLPFAKRRVAVFAMLKDKDIAGVVEICKGAFDEWFVAGIDDIRGADAQMLKQLLNQHGVNKVTCFTDVQSAYQHALSCARENDRITVFGSFFTVAACLQVSQP